MRDDFIAGLAQRAREDPSVILLTGDLGYSVVEEFAAEFPDQFFNCGVAEQAMVSLAAGLASSGRRVFVYSIVNFATFRCLEQIRNDVAYHGLDVCIVGVGAGAMYGSLGYSHHGLEDMAVTIPLPRMKVFAPGTPSEVSQALSEIFDLGGPSYIRLGRSPANHLECSETTWSLAGSNHRITAGSVAVLSTGATVDLVAEAITLAEAQGVNASWSSFWRVSPIDAHALKQLVNSRPIVTVEDHSSLGGFGAVVTIGLASIGQVPHIHAVGFDEKAPYLHGSSRFVMNNSGLDAQELASVITRLSS